MSIRSVLNTRVTSLRPSSQYEESYATESHVNPLGIKYSSNITAPIQSIQRKLRTWVTCQSALYNTQVTTHRTLSDYTEGYAYPFCSFNKYVGDQMYLIERVLASTSETFISYFVKSWMFWMSWNIWMC